MAVTWQERLRQLVMAGGVLAAGCDLGLGVCGNANPDPCICDRPSSSSAAAEACSEQTDCSNTGGVYQPGAGNWGEWGRCYHDCATNLDPCICNRPAMSTESSAACSQETSSEESTCTNAGGVWQPGPGEYGYGGTCAHDGGTASPDGSTNDGSDVDSGSRD